MKQGNETRNAKGTPSRRAAGVARGDLRHHKGVEWQSTQSRRSSEEVEAYNQRGGKRNEGAKGKRHSRNESERPRQKTRA